MRKFSRFIKLKNLLILQINEEAEQKLKPQGRMCGISEINY